MDSLVGEEDSSFFKNQGVKHPFPFYRINQAPTVGFEADVGSRTTHHFMYPESAKNLPANVSFVLVPFKALDLLWIASALSTGQIRLYVSLREADLRSGELVLWGRICPPPFHLFSKET